MVEKLILPKIGQIREKNSANNQKEMGEEQSLTYV
jgi:hypothetical protein